MRSSPEKGRRIYSFAGYEGGESGSRGAQRGRIFRKVEITGRVAVSPTPCVPDKKGDGLVEPTACLDVAVGQAAQVATYEERWQEGYRAGFKEGRERAVEEMRGIVGALETIRREMENSRASILRELEREITALALEIAEKLALQELTGNPEAVSRLVKRVVEKATDRKSLRVRLSPEDYRALQEKRRELLASLVDVGELNIVEDDQLGKGDCVVETTTGIIDARMDKRMEKIRSSVLGEVEIIDG